VNLSSFARRILQAADAATFGVIAGLGTAAYKNTGTSGNTVPLLDGANTFSAGVNQAILGSLGVGPNTGTPGERLAVGYGENVDLAVGSATSMKSYWGSFNDNAVLAINRRVSNGAYASASFPTADFGFYLFSGDAQIRFQTSSTNGSGTSTERMRINGAGFVSVLGGSFGRGAPITKTADFTVAATENNLINNKSGATCTVTLPAASSFSGREILINNIQAQTVVSASSNVVPRAGGAAGTAILAATAGAWALLVSDGTNWKIMAGS
jgi:hypothetical protein